MKFYRISARLQAPLVIQRERQSHAPAALNYLPGSTLRGALASKYLRQGGSSADAQFKSLFLESPVCFPNLIPTLEETKIPRVLPLTTLSCKRQPGFATDPSPGHGVKAPGHGVKDSLAAVLVNRLLGEKGNKEFWQCSHQTNGVPCGQDLKPFNGFWNGEVNAPRKWQADLFYKRHTGIDRQTGTVAPGIFFITQGIADYCLDEAGHIKPQYLSGGTFLSDSQTSLLRDLTGRGPLFVGADRSRGHGEIELTIEEAEPASFNLEKWDEGLREKCRQVIGKELVSGSSGRFFSLKLESPAILVDEFLRPTADLTLNFPEVKVVFKVTKTQVVRGWQESWGLPKPDDLALAAGSVFVFGYDGADLPKLEKFLQQIVKNGIGCRRPEGFGQVSICETLHLQEVI